MRSPAAFPGARRFPLGRRRWLRVEAALEAVRDPFVGAGPVRASAARTQEAVGGWSIRLRPASGGPSCGREQDLGKTLVLARALAETRSPLRRSVLVSSPADGAGLLAAWPRDSAVRPGGGEPRAGLERSTRRSGSAAGNASASSWPSMTASTSPIPPTGSTSNDWSTSILIPRPG